MEQCDYSPVVHSAVAYLWWEAEEGWEKNVFYTLGGAQLTPDLPAVPQNDATPPALSDTIEAHCQRSPPGQYPDMKPQFCGVSTVAMAGCSREVVPGHFSKQPAVHLPFLGVSTDDEDVFTSPSSLQGKVLVPWLSVKLAAHGSWELISQQLCLSVSS
ncbi:unnamed protein product [Pleuronectes platessa]|uniref:Uncharacterized protein n=1 Tax=Pleuronectes platessa TaxID=8262 RepID=A0A9N7YKZ8_PLEPL|nr:unnamed protein product [Pleuronectes platessa]